MTEVPEHLLARSRARRSAVGGGGGDEPAAASTPATTESPDAAPVAAAAAAPVPAAEAAPAKPEPVAPWVTAAKTRKKIPFWAVPVLAGLAIWAPIYALTLDEPTATEPGPFELGSEVYNGMGCSGCHGATGAGAGAVPGLVGDDASPVIFPSPADQVTWIALGTEGYEAAGIEMYGEGKAVRGSGAVMPAWMDSLSPEELMSVVLHERSTLNDEEFDAELWEEGFEEKLTAVLPADKVAEYVAVLEAWKAEPPVA